MINLLLFKTMINLDIAQKSLSKFVPADDKMKKFTAVPKFA